MCKPGNFKSKTMSNFKFSHVSDFYPTPPQVIETMLEGLNLEGKRVLEPSAGSGNIVEALKARGAEVIACEIDKDLQKILQTKCRIIADDFLTLTSDQVSHVDFIIMNPPFSRAADHINHAWKITPPGGKLIALCNSETIKNKYSKSREELGEAINRYGNAVDLGDCFSDSERKTGVNVSMVILDKPGENTNEFEGFFMEEDTEEKTGPGLMSYNVVRDLVNRYVGAIKIFDEQLETATRLRTLTKGFYGKKLGFQVTQDQAPIERNEFKKGMQKAGWMWIFSKLNMDKYATKGLKEDINKFVETQQNIPFTMRNIYKMLEIVLATTGQRMDKAILEVFDRVTSYHDDNKQGLPGWKTNSHYLLTRRFIMPNLTEVAWGGGIKANYSNNFALVEDLLKALCYVTGDNYDDMIELNQFLRYRYFLVTEDGKFVREYKDDPSMAHVKTCSDDKERLNWHKENLPGSKILEVDKQWGQWFEWSYFRIRAYKKGTIHFEFKDEDVWARFNQRVAKIKGYPLPEKKAQTAYQERQNGRKPQKQRKYDSPVKRKPVILSTIKIGG